MLPQAHHEAVPRGRRAERACHQGRCRGPGVVFFVNHHVDYIAYDFLLLQPGSCGKSGCEEGAVAAAPHYSQKPRQGGCIRRSSRSGVCA